MVKTDFIFLLCPLVQFEGLLHRCDMTQRGAVCSYVETIHIVVLSDDLSVTLRTPDLWKSHLLVRNKFNYRLITISNRIISAQLHSAIYC